MITERIDAVTAIPESHRRVDPPAPRSVKIELSPRCNFRCQYCALRTRAEQPKSDMDPAFFKRIAREMREEGVEEIGLFYLGESFMNVDLLADSILYLKRDLAVPYVFLTSNASLSTKEAITRCMAAGLDSLKWSVNAADEKQFAEVMGVAPKLFYRALMNIREAWEARRDGGYRTGLFASSILYNGEQREKMDLLLHEHVIPYVDQHYGLPLYGQMVSEPFQDAAKRGMTPTAGNQGRIGALRDPLPCWSCFTEGHVRADGLLSACCFDSDGRFAMADLNQVSFAEGWRSEKFQELRAAHLRLEVSGTICEGCIAYAG